MWEKIKSWFNRETEYLKMGIPGVAFFVIGATLLGIIGQWFTRGASNFLGAISSYPAMLANVGASLIIFYLLDAIVFKGIDTKKILKENPVLYIVFMGYIVLIIFASILKS